MSAGILHCLIKKKGTKPKSAIQPASSFGEQLYIPESEYLLEQDRL